MIGLSSTRGTRLRAWLGCAAIATGLLCGASFGVEPAPQPPPGAETLSLTVDEAMALFLKQNLDLLMAQYGIDSAKGLEVTARLFPNPNVSVDVTGGMTLSFGQVGVLALRIDQLFELAGKRGYRQESAKYGVQSAEASFADAVRTLGFAVKDAFYHVFQARQKLELAQLSSVNFAEVVKINDIRFKKGAIPEIDLI